ncbi:MAG TPA: class C beta-lactamase, partial [Sulfitobacter sp.]|nr:class C beta-lactamase [Sulfitobacter sp.]
MKFPNLALAVVLSIPFALPASLFAQGATSEQIVDIAGASFAPVI